MCGGGATLRYRRSARVSPMIYAADTQVTYEPHVYPIEIPEKNLDETARPPYCT
jgi:hypothetical protein